MKKKCYFSNTEIFLAVLFAVLLSVCIGLLSLLWLSEENQQGKELELCFISGETLPTLKLIVNV